MTFKAEDFDKKMGECPRHGEQVMWLACEHVAKGYPDEIWLGPDRIAICPACSMLPAPALEEELLVACEACIRGKIKSLSERLPEDSSLHDVVKGLEVYEKEILDAEEEPTEDH
ncbi:MAG: hypothetical protein SWH78_02535 [Thermodesulfobacteriota bacterium]|nr:hypothetical protein [Thermodesulfobacteriota bacterium]